MMAVWIAYVIGAIATGFMIWVLFELLRQQQKPRCELRPIARVRGVGVPLSSDAPYGDQMEVDHKVKGNKFAA